MDYVIRARDVTGVQIRMTAECWNEHIVVRHPVTTRHFRRIGVTNTQPDLIQRSPTPRETRFSYRRLPRRHLWLLVIAHVRRAGRVGYVKTAMVVDRIRAREILWQRH